MIEEQHVRTPRQVEEGIAAVPYGSLHGLGRDLGITEPRGIANRELRIEPDGSLPPDLAKALARVLGCRVQVDGKDLVVGLRDPARLVAALTDRGYEVRRAN